LNSRKHSAKEYIAHRLFKSVEQLEELLNKLLNEGGLIPILPKMATDERIRFNEVKDEQCQGYIN
jgi:hypothetical protein